MNFSSQFYAPKSVEVYQIENELLTFYDIDKSIATKLPLIVRVHNTYYVCLSLPKSNDATKHISTIVI